MRYLFSQAAAPILNRLAHGRALCAFDFDGTLAPITDHPDRSVLPERTKSLLKRLVTYVPCVVLSGRARADLSSRLDGIALAAVIGNHGAETEDRSQVRSIADVRQWSYALAAELRSVDGVWIEDKGFSLAVHYRASPRKREARRAIGRATRKLTDARVFGGKYVLNVTPAGAPNKGIALAAERDRLGCDVVLYVGDDWNDEDAFAISGNLISIRIGRRIGSRADYYLRSQLEMVRLLETLIALQRKTGGATLPFS